MKFWIARDSNGELWVYDHKPIKKDGIFQSDFELDKCVAAELPAWVLPEITFENSSQEVELKLVENLKMTQNKHKENIKESIELLNLYNQCWGKIDFLTKIKDTYGDLRISDIIENLEYQAVKFKTKFENLITKE